jgi:hypothetical protein
MEIDRQALLEEIKLELGLVEREDDEFTAKELCDAFKASDLIQFLESNEIGYSRRKAFAENRRQFVYRIERDTK